MASASSHSGFTLVELVLVIFILSFFALFALPDFSRRLFGDDTGRTLNWLSLNVSKYKKEARFRGVPFYMGVFPGENAIRITDTSPETAGTGLKWLAEFDPGEHVRIRKVVFRGRRSTGDLPYIHFSPRGFSDDAAIHISGEKGAAFSCIIRPFLDDVEIRDTNAGFNAI